VAVGHAGLNERRTVFLYDRLSTVAAAADARRILLKNPWAWTDYSRVNAIYGVQTAMTEARNGNSMEARMAWRVIYALRRDLCFAHRS
jgi:hypothetical protein